ncbi:MAG: HNH endonuclease [Muribaculaceae bacterium]
MIKYNIYPSLLIKYQELLDYEYLYNEYWGNSDDPKYNLEEFYLIQEANLINSINRVPFENEAASCGTAFNEIVDCLIENRKSSREDCIIKSKKDNNGNTVIEARIHDFVFDFDLQLCRETADYFTGSIPQYLAKAVMSTDYGNVLLYGFADEWVSSQMFDIKTTGKYSWGKFEKGWQRHVYPWCAIESGDATEIESFTYYVIEWAYQRKGEPLKAKGVYLETYTYNHEESGVMIREILESFIGWLLSRRIFIQDQRIFGGKNPEGWHSRPVDIKELEKAIFGNNLKTA